MRGRVAEVDSYTVLMPSVKQTTNNSQVVDNKQGRAGCCVADRHDAPMDPFRHMYR